jgi:hypothetical protein
MSFETQSFPPRALFPLAAILLLASLPEALGQTRPIQQDDKAQLVRPTAAAAPVEAIATGNAIYEIFVQDIPGFGLGLYTARTGLAHPVPRRNLLFGGEDGSPGTSFTTVRSYTTNTDYVQHTASTSPGFTVVDLDRFGIVRPFGADGIQTIYDLSAPGAAPDRLRIVQTIRVVGSGLSDSRVEFHLRVENAGTTPVRIGIRHLWDFEIGFDDGPTFTPHAPDGPTLIHEARFAPPEFGFYRVEDNALADPTSPLYQVFGTASGPAVFSPTPPDAIKHVAWPLAFGTAFDYTVDPNLIISTFQAPHRGHAGGDSAVLIYFGSTAEQAVEIAPGQSYSALSVLFAQTTPAPPDERNPVLIVPGIMGSWSRRLVNPISRDGWNLEQILKTFNLLYEGLQSAGYRAVGPAQVEWFEGENRWETETAGANLFPAAYDWRKPVQTTAKEYLVAQIDRAKEVFCRGRDDTESCLMNTRVDIVAYSMGGLVARSYLQGSDYRDDVDKLIILGTPNHGSAHVYTWWQGGEPPLSELSRLLLDLVLEALVPDWIILLGEFRAPAIRTIVPSLQDLLPAADYQEYLVDDATGMLKPPDSLTAFGRNPTLENMNSSPDLPGSVHYLLIGGRNEETIELIRVKNRGFVDSMFRRWFDGTPVRFEHTTLGDGKVILQSLRLEGLPSEGTVAGKHHCLPNLVVNEIAAALLERPIAGLSSSRCPSLVRSLIATIRSRLNSPPAADLLIIDPLGRRVGFDSGTQLSLTDVPDSFYSGRDAVSILIIPDPPPGFYQFVISGNNPGMYEIASTYLGPEGIGRLQSSGAVATGSVETFLVQLDPAAEKILDSDIPPATDLVAGSEVPGLGLAGSEMSLTLLAANAGPHDATGVLLSLALPGPFEFVSATPSRGTCSVTTTVSCDFGILPPDELATVNLVLRPTAAGVFPVEVRVSSSTADPVEANNVASAEVTINNPAPVLDSLSPANVTAGSGAFTLEVTGTGFVAGSTVRWNGADRPTTFVSSTRLQASISASDLSAGGIIQITVFNPAPGGGTSAATSFAVTDFALGTTTPSATVNAGQAANYTLTVTPQHGPFGNAVNFACSGLPARAACSFNPSSVTPGDNPANTTLTITTAAAGMAPPMGWRLVPQAPPLPVIGLLGLLLLFLLAGRRPIPKRRRAAALASIALLIAVAVFQLACASAETPPPPPTQPGTPPGTYTVTVTASSGSLERTTNVTLTVR